MARKKTFRNMGEVRKAFFPNSTLDRLLERIKTIPGVSKDNSDVRKEGDNQRLGVIRILMNDKRYDLEYEIERKIIGITKEFYSKEGYRIKGEGNMTMDKGKDSLWVTVNHIYDAYAVFVKKNPFKNCYNR